MRVYGTTSAQLVSYEAKSDGRIHTIATSLSSPAKLNRIFEPNENKRLQWIKMFHTDLFLVSHF